jgi:hypothetical protein
MVLSQSKNVAQEWSVANMLTPRKVDGFMEPKDDSDELLDMLENGFARESITEECLSPCQSDNEAEAAYPNKQFIFQRVGKECMQLHSDTRDGFRFLLSAKRDGDDFYISPYSFDNQEGDVKQMRRCAVLKKTPYGANGECYSLMLDGSDVCDRSQIYEGVCEQDDRQKLLAQIWHSTSIVKETGTILRALRVTVPPHTKESVRDQWETGSNSSDSDSSISSDSSTTSCDPIQLTTKLPRWNDEKRCFSQKFHENRVRGSSSKNFVLTADKALPKEEQGIAMQFGKRKSHQYILDHGKPLSTLQAFAIALSMCNWIGEE